jgi:NADPH-dependent glutamate synthase beta subunit-like oxidoreductase
VNFQGGKYLPEDLSPEQLLQDRSAVFLATGASSRQSITAWLGVATLQVEPATMALLEKPGFFAGGGLVREECTAVQSVADGRAAAMGIAQETH